MKKQTKILPKILKGFENDQNVLINVLTKLKIFDEKLLKFEKT